MGLPSRKLRGALKEGGLTLNTPARTPRNTIDQGGERPSKRNGIVIFLTCAAAVEA